MSAGHTRQTPRRDGRWPLSLCTAGSRRTPFAMARSGHQHGFTLLEVIAAIMLLAIAFTALMQVAGASIALTQNAAAHSAAAMWARSKLDSAFITTPLQIGRSTGQFDQQFVWQLDVTPWGNQGVPVAPTSLQLYQLDLAVSWGPRSHPRSAHFHTLRLAAAQPDAGVGAASGQLP